MIKIGITKEYKIPNDFRTPFTPMQANEINKLENFSIVCQSSNIRCFEDKEYEKESIEIVENLDDCNIIFGIKEVPKEKLIATKTYFMFSHTIKKQLYNRPLLKEIINKKIRLIDYECLTNNGKRIIAFGKYAGIAGAYNTIMGYGKKLKLFNLDRLSHYKDTDDLYRFTSKFKLKSKIKILIIGDGRVAQGAVELLKSFKIIEVNINDYINKDYNQPVYCQLGVKDYMKRKDGKGFEEIEYFNNPESFVSNYQIFSGVTNILINAAFWDPKSPKLFEEDNIDEKFSATVIGDISCDIDGAIPCTKMASTIKNPFFDYCIEHREITKPFSNKNNITIMSIDNLPSELPRDSSMFFGKIIKDKILPILKNDENKIIENATITKDGKLTENYKYLSDYVG